MKEVFSYLKAVEVVTLPCSPIWQGTIYKRPTRMGLDVGNYPEWDKRESPHLIRYVSLSLVWGLNFVAIRLDSPFTSSSDVASSRASGGRTRPVRNGFFCGISHFLLSSSVSCKYRSKQFLSVDAFV